MRKVVVTGGAGFIGSHLVEALVQKDFNVIILDDLSTGKIENIQSLVNHNDVEFINGSIADLSLLQKLFDGVQYVFHHAASISVPESIENPILYNENNVAGTLNVLKASKDNNVSKVVFASSCAVYGDNDKLPITENILTSPISPYATTKLQGEYLCEQYNVLHNLSTVCLRYFNVYGTRQSTESRYAAAIPNFIRKAINNEPPIIYGDGKQSRDFVFVQDVVTANILAAESSGNGIFNIASGKTITISEVAKIIIGLSGNQLELDYRKPRHGDVKHCEADITKARYLGYEPAWTIQKGLEFIFSQY